MPPCGSYDTQRDSRMPSIAAQTPSAAIRTTRRPRTCRARRGAVRPTSAACARRRRRGSRRPAPWTSPNSEKNVRTGPSSSRMMSTQVRPCQRPISWSRNRGSAIASCCCDSASARAGPWHCGCGLQCTAPSETGFMSSSQRSTWARPRRLRSAGPAPIARVGLTGLEFWMTEQPQAAEVSGFRKHLRILSQPGSEFCHRGELPVWSVSSRGDLRNPEDRHRRPRWHSRRRHPLSR